MASPSSPVASDAALTIQARGFVERHLGDTLAAFPAAVRDALVDKFLADYCAPRTAQLECVLRKRLTDDEVRHLLFAPTPAQYRFYADLLSLRAPVEREDPVSWQCVVRKRFLTLFYLKHARNWPLVVEFVLRDGLQILVDLFLHDDLQMRGQAIDSFVQLTSNSAAFEWFDAPVGYEARVLHAKMIALATPEAGFLRRVVANIRLYEEPEQDDTTKRLPGGTLVLLQLLAFFLSWVRKFYTRNELRLSRELLELLRDWPARTRCDSEEERSLAQQVYEDFSRWPAIEDACDEKREDRSTTTPTPQHISLTGASDVSPGKDVFSRAKVDELMRLAQADSDGESEDSAVERAIALCSEAIDAEMNAADALLCRAQVRLQQIQRAHATRANVRASASVVDQAEQCLRDCGAVLEQEPGDMAAWRCQLTLLETMEMWRHAHDVLASWHASHEAGEGPFYMAEDVAYLVERREFFDGKVTQEAHEAAATTRQHATREAKEQLVYQLLLQRTAPRRESGAEVVSPQDETTAAPRDHQHQAHAQHSESAPRDVLARFRSSSSATGNKKTKKHDVSTADAPLGGVVKARAFVRKFAQCKRDALAVRRLLLASRVQDVNGAVETALPEDSLALVLEALITTPDDDESASDDELLRMLRHLLSLRRFELMREMAAPAQQRQIDDHVQRAHDLLGTAWAA